jgi:hypothetical protein
MRRCPLSMRLAMCALAAAAAAPTACASSPATQGFTAAEEAGAADGSTSDSGSILGDGSSSSKEGGASGDGDAQASHDGATSSEAGSSSGGGDSSTGTDGNTSTGGDSGTTGSPDAAPDSPSITTPWDISWCPGAAITESQVLAIFAPAATSATLATVTLDARQRQCQDQTGCQGWTASTTLPLYAIVWNGSGFNFTGPTNIAVPATGTAVCTVPGPTCTATVGPLTALVYSTTTQQITPWGVSPDVNGSQAQVGNWSQDPSGNYVEYGGATTASSCLFGTENGRVYGTSGLYTEYQMVLYAQF